ncbi:hypothetical protein BH10PSE17_BH10PSE17_23190 [soil metagenome]
MSTVPAATATGAPKGVTRVRGVVLMVIGTLLCLGMLFGVVSLAPTFLHPGQQVGGTTFTGTPGQGMLGLALMLWISVTGGCAAAAGLQLFKRGAIGRILKPVLIVMFVGLFLFVFAARGAFS